MKDNKFAMRFSLIIFIVFIVLDIYLLFTGNSMWTMMLAGLSLVIFSMLLLMVIRQMFEENEKK